MAHLNPIDNVYNWFTWSFIFSNPELSSDMAQNTASALGHYKMIVDVSDLCLEVVAAATYDCRIAQILFLKYQPCNMYYPPSFCIIHQVFVLSTNLFVLSTNSYVLSTKSHVLSTKICIIYQLSCIIHHLNLLSTNSRVLSTNSNFIIHQLKFYYPPTPVTQISQCRVCRSRLMFKLILESADRSFKNTWILCAQNRT